jgi:hypothetical protein
MAYGVWCAVSGGVTGHRESWMKDNGKRLEFETFEEAKAVATNACANVSPHSRASFSYVPRSI